MSHEAYKEALVSEALNLHATDTGEQGEAAELRTHLATCADCQAELRRLRETVAQLAYAVTPVEAPASVRTALLQRIESSTQDELTPDQELVPSADASPVADFPNAIFFSRRAFVFGAGYN